MNRALPGTVIDLIRDGADEQDLRARGDRAVWSALVRTASSARQRGWSRVEWADLVTGKRSRLGYQAAMKGSKERSRVALEKSLRGAWDAAARWLATTPAPITRGDVESRARNLRDYAADASTDLRDNDRAILCFAADVPIRRGTDRPTLPLRAISEATGLSVKAIRLALPRLDASGLLRLEVRGTPGGPNTKERRASAYRLGDATEVAITQPTTPPTTTVTEDDPMATITIQMDTLTDEQRTVILAALGRTTAAQLPVYVVPLRRTA
jgi:hypothetical protein